MESCLEDVDRSSGNVERRVSEELVVERQASVLSESNVIIRFKRQLGGVAQVAVAVLNAQSASFQERLLGRRNTGHIAGQTECVAGPVPRSAFDAQTQLGRPVRVVEGSRSRLAVWPSTHRTKRTMVP